MKTRWTMMLNAAFVCAAAGVALAAQASDVPLTNARVERKGEMLSITWRDDEPVSVYSAQTPDAPMTKRELESARDADGRHEIAADRDRRQYVFLRSEKSGDAQWVAERVLPLEGGFNFRDAGGYETSDGERVRWGKIYRSGTMADLTDRDYDYLGKLGIRTVCDFRSTQERENEPTRWPSIDRSLEYKAVDYDMSGMRKPQNEKANIWEARTAGQARAAFLENYRHGALELKQQYTAMFDELAQGNAPLAFNCSAGKDRTGRAAALILAALGVPRETIVADYALTEKVADFGARERAQNANRKDVHGVGKMPPEVRRVLLRSDPEYIEAMLDQLEQDYGSVVAFIQRELGVSDAELAELRRLYLES